VNYKAHILKEISVGIFACHGNGFTGMKLVNKVAISLYGPKSKGPILKETFAGIPASQTNLSIGTGHALIHAQSLSQMNITMEGGSVSTLAKQRNLSIGMVLVLKLAFRLW